MIFGLGPFFSFPKRIVRLFELVAPFLVIYFSFIPDQIYFLAISIGILVFHGLHSLISKKILINNAVITAINLLVIISLFSGDLHMLLSIAISFSLIHFLVSDIVIQGEEKSPLLAFLFSVLIQTTIGIAFISISSGFVNEAWNEHRILLYLIIMSIAILSSVMFYLFNPKRVLWYLPVFIVTLLNLLLQRGNPFLAQQFILGIVFAALIALVSLNLRFLSDTGSAATFLLASTIFGFGGIQWSIPIMAFFILSSVLSKIRKKNNEKVDLYFEKTGVRDHWQVLANGGAGGILVLLAMYGNEQFFYYLYLGSLAAVCADTWATEIGTYNKANTYNVLTFKPAEQGISGGVSVIGSFAALLGAVTICLSGFFWISGDVLFISMLIIFSGFAGSLIDSILGATLQLQYFCPTCEKITERKNHCGNETKYYRGIRFINNDVVNFLAAFSAIMIVIIFRNFIV